MADRSVRIVLTAVTSGLTAGFRTAQTAADDLGKSVGKSARENSQAWTTVGTTLTAVGGAITAVGAAALKTGIQYNTLQQTSRAALTTLLGSAEAANAQMDKLDDFARNSPFAKQVFIEAQRQLLGFGMAAEDVVPTLDAIQNGVAAMGGSNQDIAEIVNIFAQIEGQGKITGRELQRLGLHGINAAEIIGQQMGMTGGQIRDEITAGSIDARTALDALTAGMQDSFGGAAENVKNTFEGAVDRVKAAWRDLSSELAAPLVDPEGGGLAVDWLNDLADAMRAFQGLPGPVKATAAAVAGLTGAGALGAGMLLLAVPRYVAFKDSLATLAQVSPRAATAIGGFTRTAGRMVGIAAIIGATAAATGKLVDALKGHDVALGAEALARAVREIAESGGDIGDLSGQFNNFGTVLGMSVNEADSLQDAFDQLLNPSTTDRISRFFGQLPGVTSYMENLEERAASLDETLSGMVTAGEIDAVNAFRSELEAMGYTTEQINELLPQTADALIGVEESSKRAGSAQSGLADDTEAAAEAAERQAEMVQGLIDLHREMAGQVLSQRDAQRRYEAALDDGTKALETNGATLDTTTEKGRANEAALDDIAKAGYAVIDTMRENGASQEDLQAKMRRTRDDFLNLAERMGMSEAKARDLADELGLIPSSVRVDVDVDTDRAERNIASLMSTWSGKTIQMYARLSTSTAGLPHGNPRIGGGYTGGIVGNLAGGGMVPGTPPANPRADNVLAATDKGSLLAVRSGEWIINERQSRANDRWLRAINAGLVLDDMVAARFATGGRVAPAPSAPAPAAMGGLPGGLNVSVGQVVAADPDAAMKAMRSEFEWAMVGSA